MKQTVFVNLFAFLLVIGIATSGCHPKPKDPTPIPTAKAKSPDTKTYPPETVKGIPPDEGNPKTSGVNTQDPGVKSLEGNPLAGFDPEKMDQDRGPLAAYTVYFDLDKSTIKSSEKSKIESVGSYLNANAQFAVLIEGHCDERGTEQYNLSLGERRALAVREYLINLGISSQRVHTITYGESRPADPGHNEAAWAKNRRDEFVVLKPKQ